jgi:hypothetical protein
MASNTQPLPRKKIILRVVLVLIGFAAAVWAAGTFYTPYKITSEKPQLNAKLASNALFVTLLELEEKNWKLDTEAMGHFIQEEFKRQGLSQIEFVKARSATGQTLADKKQQPTEPNAVLSAQDPAYLTMQQVREMGLQRQVLVFTTESMTAGSRSGDVKNVEWSLKLYQGPEKLWQGTINRDSNGLLDYLRNAHRVAQALSASDRAKELSMDNSDWVKIAKLLSQRMAQDGLLAAQ